MHVFIGIDPSINSTGITIKNSDGSCNFFIVKGGRLTKKEKEASLKYVDIFKYILYDKKEVKETEDRYEFELAKAHNLSCIADTILSLINDIIYNMNKESKVESISICMEGISYGSIKSAAIMDLAGLNYLIRDRLKEKFDNFFICPPAEIKKFYTGSGNSNKDLMIKAFRGTFPDLNLPKIDDLVDSYAMASFVQNKIEKEG